MQVAEAAARARCQRCRNSTQRESPARAAAKTSSGSRSRKRRRMARWPRMPSRCPRPPEPQKRSRGSRVTTKWPPSPGWSERGYRPKPTPSPRCQTRTRRSSWPRVAAMPAAMASASLSTDTGNVRPCRASAAESAVWRWNPLNCCRLGHSSMVPPTMMPGKPTPTAAISKPPAASTICSLRLWANCSAGMERRLSPPLPGSGKIRTGAARRSFSTRPTQICLVASTPIDCRMAKSSGFNAGQLIQPVKRRRLVTFCERRIVEDRIHEIIHRALENEHRLPDVQQFGGAFADDMHAEQFPGFAVEDEFEAPRRVAADLAAGGFAVEGHPDLVGNVFIGQLLLGFADE